MFYVASQSRVHGSQDHGHCLNDQTPWEILADEILEADPSFWTYKLQWTTLPEGTFVVDLSRPRDDISSATHGIGGSSKTMHVST